MKLALVTDAWLPQVNGVVRTLENVISGLAKRGIATEIIAPSDYYSMSCPTYSEIRLALPSPIGLSRRLKAMSADAIHIATEGPLGLLARFICLWNGWKFTTSFHTRFPEYVAERFPVPLSLTYAMMRRFHNKAALTLVPTRSIYDILAERGFSNLKIWSRGVDRALYHPMPEVDLGLPKPIFLNVGRVSIEKNLEAFLSLDLPGTKLIVGDGPALANLKAKYQDTVFVGKKHGKDLARYYAGSDVFVFPSRTDTFGLVLLEAIASGLPVAAFPVSGALDVVKGTKAGVLSENLQQAALQALNMGKMDPERALGNFTWEHCVDIFAESLVPCFQTNNFIPQQ
ncbi:glycosyltransferase family 1 protein [Bartonella sp. HY329]|uniref:glycosyltransferase family 4 protein n=1 Tax=unclassified Bartonella TaxID=2645622 RepID=UPI0021C7E638|nr:MULTISPECIES: glycosyltransferase family 1 protein [unclassified Bartonella]UXM94977.1 glycosyltransferase family 1 protein [Bartonella sp. HY329]UXN09300.1 glycosyltransferase family 1 protein [Bartonella sp. HY328]